MSEKKKYNPTHLIIGFLVLIATWLVLGIAPYLVSNSFDVNLLNKPLEKFGVLGDSFGMVNSLFSALAFLVIAASLYYQRKDLQVTMEEMTQTREAQQLAAKVAEKQLGMKIQDLNLKLADANFQCAFEVAKYNRFDTHRTELQENFAEAKREYSNHLIIIKNILDKELEDLKSKTEPSHPYGS